MNQRDIHLSNIQEHAKRFRRVANTYEHLAKMAEREDSQLAPLLDQAGNIVADGMERSGALLECLFQGLTARQSNEDNV